VQTIHDLIAKAFEVAFGSAVTVAGFVLARRAAESL